MLSSNRLKIFIFIVVTLFVILISRVFYLQIIGDKELKYKAIENKVKTTSIYPARGYIYDRNGVLLIDNIYSYNLYVVPEQILDDDFSISFLSEVILVSKDSLIRKISKDIRFRNRKLKIKRDIGIELYSKFEENSSKLYGVIVKKEWKRNFRKNISPHLIGYLSELKELPEIEEGKRDKSDIILGDLIGKAGLEAVYDKSLRGKKGKKRELRDVRNNTISDYDKENWKDAKKGDNLYLTIDYDLQSYITDRMKGKVGAVVVLDVNTGEVLSMVSLPDYPNDLFSKNLPEEEWKYWSTHEDKPLRNKAVLGEYPPGSVLKMGNILAAYDQKVISKRKKVNCLGGMKIGRRFIKCWNHSGHGNMNAIQAIMNSCDTYFYEISKHIDLNGWSDYLKQFGFGEKTGIDLTYEKRGNIPDEEYYTRRFKGSNIGRYANLMIGQGEVLTTPLQIALYTSMIANGGCRYTPHLFLKSSNGDDDNFSFYNDSMPLITDTIAFNKRQLRDVRKGMFHVVNTDGGTARRSKSELITYAGKTGTAQNPHGDDHAWFTCFAPYKNPEIAITVFVAHGKHGSGVAPIAKGIIEKYYELKKK